MLLDPWTCSINLWWTFWFLLYFSWNENSFHTTPEYYWFAQFHLPFSNSPCSYAWRINITKTNNKSCRNIISKGSSYLSATHYLLTYAFNNNLFLPCSTNYCSQMNCFTSRLDWTPLPKRSRLLWKDIGRSNRMTKCLQCGPSYHVRYDERTKGCSIRNNSCNSSHKEAVV